MDEADVTSEQFGQERGAQALPKQFVVDFFQLHARSKANGMPMTLNGDGTFVELPASLAVGVRIPRQEFTDQWVT